jgi:hypothetical protein
MPNLSSAPVAERSGPICILLEPAGVNGCATRGNHVGGGNNVIGRLARHWDQRVELGRCRTLAGLAPTSSGGSSVMKVPINRNRER